MIETSEQTFEFDQKFTVIKKRENSKMSTESIKKSLLILAVIFIIALSSLLLVYKSLPQFDDEEWKAFKLPRSIDDAKLLGRVLSKYKESHFMSVTVGFFMTYIFLQSFAIPGSIFLSILSGFLYPFYLAIFLVCLASATGASFCYLLSYFFGKTLIWKLFPQKAADWSDKVHKHSSNLLNYMIFLRITPIIPNWFINLASPIIDVPLSTFFIGTFLGVAPPSIVFIKAGTALQELTSADSTISIASIAILGLLAIASLLPVLFKARLSEKFD